VRSDEDGLMGHYDSCRDAEEEYALERRGLQFRDLLDKRSHKEIGQLLEQYERLLDLAKDMNGTAGQHRTLQSINGKIADFYKRFRP
jgi:hypothetical protein